MTYLVIDTASGQTVREFAATRLPQALYMAAALSIQTTRTSKPRDYGTGQRFVVKSSRCRGGKSAVVSP